MPAQTAIAVQAGLSVPAVAALQHVSGTAMSLFSPVRMSIAANRPKAVARNARSMRRCCPARWPRWRCCC